MPYQKYSTTREEISQGNGNQDDWTKEVLPRLPSNREEQAKKLKAFERSRQIGSATDLLRGLLAYVYIAHSFQHLSMWSVLVGVADVSANDWRKRLQKASAWLDWLLQEVLAIASVASVWLVRAGVKRILLIDGTHWKCLGPKGMVWRVHTAFDLLAGRLTQLKVTDQSEAEHLEVFDLQPGDLVVTDRANGLRTRIVFVLSKMAHIIVRISPSKFPMEDEQGASMVVLDWLKGLQASAGQICSRPVWISCAHKRFKLRLIAFRLSQDQQEKAERRTKRKASKNKQKVRTSTLYFSGWVLVVTTLPEAHWSDQQILQLYRARWHIELLFKRIKQLLKKQSLRCKTAATAKATITLLLLGWALLEEESAAVRLAMRDAIHCAQQAQEASPLRQEAHTASWWQDDLDAPLSEWMLAEASFDLFCQQVRGSYTAERFRACLPRLQRFLCCGHRNRPHLYTQVCHWLGVPAARPQDGDRAMIA
jgi:Transposase DDE domain